MIPAYMFVHPVLGLIVIALALTAFSVKTARQKRHRLHYASGLGALGAVIVAVGVAAAALGRITSEGGGEPSYLPVIDGHIVAAGVGITILFAQAALGLRMLTNVRTMRGLMPIHRALGRLLMGVIVVVVFFGGFKVLELVEDGNARTLIFIVAQLVAGATIALLILDFRHSLRHRRHPRSGLPEREVHLNGGAATPVRVYYQPDNVDVSTDVSKTILTTSLEAGIAHTHVCGGNARCSTCRISVVEGLEFCQPRNDREHILAERLMFSPEVRLACQTRIDGDVKVRRLVLDDNDIQITSQINPGAAPESIGEEKHLAILFTDIRGFTSFAESLPPYDVVHALNRFYQQVDQAISRAGGDVNNYMGDGMLVLFEGATPAEASLRAVQAALGMLDAVTMLKPYFEATYGRPLDIGIGIHYGQVVVGSVGVPRQKRLAVIGDAVNFASRIESANKETGTHLLISDDTYEPIKDRVQVGKSVTIMVKGKTGEHMLYEVVGVSGLGHKQIAPDYAPS
jgi:adenylate cyclase